MRNFFFAFSFASSCVVCLFAVIVTLFNLYLYIRKRIPISVNCWFCNTWTKVDYNSRNSFECPACLQYNGFTNDGGYDRTIDKQHDVYLNPNSFASRRTYSKSKSLCAKCNHNQELKVIQLANFVPMVERNYDTEVEHFEKQLDKAYMLCKRCEDVLKITLQEQDLNILAKIQKEINSLFDVKKSETPLILFFAKFVRYCIVLFSCAIILNTIATLDYSDRNLKKLLPHYLFNTASRFKVILNSVYKNSPDFEMEALSNYFADFINVVAECRLVKYTLQVIAEKIPSFLTFAQRESHFINSFLMSISGLLLQIIFCFSSMGKLSTKVPQIVSWLIVLGTVVKRFPLNWLLRICCLVFIIYTCCARPTLKRKTRKQSSKRKKRNMRKLGNGEELLSDSSDYELQQTAFHDSFVSEKSSTPENVKKPFNKTDVAKTKAETDLNTSLNNLDLGGRNAFASKPLLFPSRLNVTKNPWTAGGFWSKSYNYPGFALGNLSRSSSQSSGFGSHANENLNFSSLPSSPRNSMYGGDDRLSLFSEPAFNSQFEVSEGRNGAVMAQAWPLDQREFFAGGYGSRAVYWQPNGGVLWHRNKNFDDRFAYVNRANFDWPYSTGYVQGSLFKNVSGEEVDTASFDKVK